MYLTRDVGPQIFFIEQLPLAHSTHGPFRTWPRIRGDIRQSVLDSGVNDIA
jgi:hypothetical protein